MIKNKKLLITIACLTVILCTLVTGTIAWLTAKTPSITNTFAPSSIGLALSETTGTNYKMVPGKAIPKDPVVTVTANSEACYLFVKIEKANDFDAFMEYAVDTSWTELTTGSGIYYRQVAASNADQKFGLLASGELTINEQTYTWTNNQVLVRPDVTKDMMKSLYNDDGTVKTSAVPTLTFTAYAIQSEGFTNATAAWTEAKNAPASNGN